MDAFASGPGRPALRSTSRDLILTPPSLKSFLSLKQPVKDPHFRLKGQKLGFTCLCAGKITYGLCLDRNRHFSSARVNSSRQTRSNHVCHFTPPASLTPARRGDVASMFMPEQLCSAEVEEEHDPVLVNGSSVISSRESLEDIRGLVESSETQLENSTVERAVHVPDAFTGKLIGARSRHLKELRHRTGVESITYCGDRKEIQVSGTATSVAAAVEALQMRISFLRNAAQLQSAIYPHPCKQYFLLAEGFQPGGDVRFVASASSPCLGGEMACEMESFQRAGKRAASAEPVRLPREAHETASCDSGSHNIFFFDSAFKRNLLKDFLSSVRVLEAHQSPAPFDQVKVLFVLGVQQFYPLAPYHPPLEGRTMSFQRLQYMKVTDPHKSLRSELCTVLSQDLVKRAASQFRQRSVSQVEVVRARGIDVYLSDHKLSVAVRIRFEIPRNATWLEQRLQLHPVSIKTTNSRPFMLTFLNPAGTLDFRIELSARYELHSDNSENIRELWRMARGCMWDPERPSEVKLPRDTISRFSIRRVKYWEDATLVGRIPWKASRPGAQNGAAKTRQSGGRRDECEIQLAVTKSYDRKQVCYSITGSSPQLDNSKGPMTLGENELDTIIDFCRDLCQVLNVPPAANLSAFGGG